MSYANDYLKSDGKFRLHCIGHAPGITKTDAFLFEYNGKYTLVDGGMVKVTAAYDYLLKLRRSLLADHPELADDTSCKLKIDWMPSHFHVDHVGATLEQIIPCEFIEFDTIYLPPDSSIDQKYNWKEGDGDTKFRPRLAEALEKYQPNAKVVQVKFGKENVVELENGRMKYAILPSDIDYGTPENVEKYIDQYFPEDRMAWNIPIAVVNSCVVWVHIKFGRHSFLLTGDTMKKLDHCDKNEPFDDMLETYGERLGKVSVVKYPHHGKNRDIAAGSVLSLKPGWIFCSAEDATAPQIIKERFPRSRAKVLNCGNTTYVFATDGKKMEITSSNFPCVKE